MKKRGEEEETRTPTSQLTLPPQSSASTNSATSPNKKECPEQDSNLHASRHTHLKRARLPIPPPGHFIEGAIPQRSFLFKMWSGKRDSDPRPQPWQGCALPTELFPPFLRKAGIFGGTRHQVNLLLSFARKFRIFRLSLSIADAKVMLFSELTNFSATFLRKNFQSILFR